MSSTVEPIHAPNHQFFTTSRLLLPEALPYNNKHSVYNNKLMNVRNLLCISNIYGYIFVVNSTNTKLYYTQTNKLLQYLQSQHNQNLQDDTTGKLDILLSNSILQSIDLNTNNNNHPVINDLTLSHDNNILAITRNNTIEFIYLYELNNPSSIQPISYPHNSIILDVQFNPLKYNEFIILDNDNIVSLYSIKDNKINKLYQYDDISIYSIDWSILNPHKITLLCNDSIVLCNAELNNNPDYVDLINDDEQYNDYVPYYIKQLDDVNFLISYKQPVDGQNDDNIDPQNVVHIIQNIENESIEILGDILQDKYRLTDDEKYDIRYINRVILLQSIKIALVSRNKCGEIGILSKIEQGQWRQLIVDDKPSVPGDASFADTYPLGVVLDTSNTISHIQQDGSFSDDNKYYPILFILSSDAHITVYSYIPDNVDVNQIMKRPQPIPNTLPAVNQICEINNPDSVSICQSCKAPKPGTKPTNTFNTSQTNNTSGFTFGTSQHITGTPSFTFGNNNNNNNTQPAPPSFSFGNISTTSTQSSTTGSFGFGFSDPTNKKIEDKPIEPMKTDKPTSTTTATTSFTRNAFAAALPKGGWTCEVCDVNNPDGVTQCGSCSTSKPGRQPITKSVNIPQSQFTFGVSSNNNNSFTPSTSNFTFGSTQPITSTGFTFGTTTSSTQSNNTIQQLMAALLAALHTPYTTTTTQPSFGGTIAQSQPSTSTGGFGAFGSQPTTTGFGDFAQFPVFGQPSNTPFSQSTSGFGSSQPSFGGSSTGTGAGAFVQSSNTGGFASFGASKTLDLSTGGQSAFGSSTTGFGNSAKPFGISNLQQQSSQPQQQQQLSTTSKTFSSSFVNTQQTASAPQPSSAQTGSSLSGSTTTAKPDSSKSSFSFGSTHNVSKTAPSFGGFTFSKSDNKSSGNLSFKFGSDDDNRSANNTFTVDSNTSSLLSLSGGFPFGKTDTEGNKAPDKFKQTKDASKIEEKRQDNKNNVESTVKPTETTKQQDSTTSSFSSPPTTTISTPTGTGSITQSTITQPVTNVVAPRPPTATDKLCEILELRDKCTLESIKKFLTKHPHMPINQLNASGRYIISYAVQTNNIDIVQFFLDKNTDINALDTHKRSALYYALVMDYPLEGSEMVRYLISKDANTDMKQCYPDSNIQYVGSGQVEELYIDGVKLSLTKRYWLRRGRDDPSNQYIAVKLRQMSLSGLREVMFNVVGQTIAAQSLMNIMWMHRSDREGKAGVKPLVLIFAGPPGHGKTMLATAFAKSIGLGNMCLFHDCTKTTTRWGMFGSEQGYVGSNKHSAVTEYIVENAGGSKECVVVLDEFEKMNRDVYDGFLAPFENGIWTDNIDKKTISCKNVIFILTTNAFDSEIKQYFATRTRKSVYTTHEYKQIMRDIRSRTKSVKERIFGLPLSRRMPHIIPFLPFSDEEQSVVADGYVRVNVQQKYSKPPNQDRILGLLNIHYNDDLPKHLAKSYDVNAGASSIDSEIGYTVRDQLAMADQEATRHNGQLKDIWLYVQDDEVLLSESKIDYDRNQNQDEDYDNYNDIDQLDEQSDISSEDEEEEEQNNTKNYPAEHDDNNYYTSSDNDGDDGDSQV